MAQTGASSYVQWGVEKVAYATEAASIIYSFGHEVSINTESKNTFIESRGLGSRDVQAFIAGKFESAVTISGILADAHWLAAFFGSASTASSAPYNHTIVAANTLPSLTIEDGTDLATDSIRKYLGCVGNTVRLSLSEGDEPVRFSAEFWSKTETHGTTIDSSPAAAAETPMNFAQASVDLPSSTTLTAVKRTEILIDNGLKRSYGLGSRFASCMIPGKRSYSINLDKSFENLVDLLQKFYGAAGGPNATIAETATCVVNITNGLSGASERHFAFTFTGCVLDTHSIEKKMEDEEIESVPIKARTAGLIIQDATSTTPFDP